MTAVDLIAAIPQAAEAVVEERAEDRAAVDALIMAAFGPGRYAKTAERLREHAALAGGFVARENGRIVGSVRLWTLAVGDVAAVFLGPIAVDAAHRKGGVGADLVAACVEAARRLNVGGVLLVGDLAYFERFGFVQATGVRLPGPVDPRRVLWLAVNAPEPSGTVRPVG